MSRSIDGLSAITDGWVTAIKGAVVEVAIEVDTEIGTEMGTVGAGNETVSIGTLGTIGTTTKLRELAVPIPRLRPVESLSIISSALGTAVVWESACVQGKQAITSKVNRTHCFNVQIFNVVFITQVKEISVAKWKTKNKYQRWVYTWKG